MLQGNAQRVWTLSTQDYWAQDDFQATKRLSLNYGVRYTIPGVIQAAKNDIYMFIPGSSPSPTPGFVKGYYPEYYGAFAPRVGFSYSLFDNSNTVLRGAFGIFYDRSFHRAASISGTSPPMGAPPTRRTTLQDPIMQSLRLA